MPSVARRVFSVVLLSATLVALVGIAAPAVEAATGTPTLVSPAGGSTHAIVRTQVQVWLRPNERAAQAFVDAVTTPGTPSYGRYLSPDSYTQRFGATAGAADAVVRWLRRAGMHQVRISAQRNFVAASADAASIGRAFRSGWPAGRTRAGQSVLALHDDTALTHVPGEIERAILNVTGLPVAGGDPETAPTVGGTAAPLTTAGAAPPVDPSSAPCSRYWGEHSVTVSPPFEGITRASTSVCGYSADQIRGAYGLTAEDTGAGVTVAIVLPGAADDVSTLLTDYAARNGLPSPMHGQVHFTFAPGAAHCAKDGGAEGEEDLDSEAVYAMAPAATQLIIDGNACDGRVGGLQTFLDAELVPIDGDGRAPSASIVSNSWDDEGGEDAEASIRETIHAFALRAAAEGVGLYFGAGDDGGSTEPSTDPDVTSVGGTTLGIGANGDRLFETGWSDGGASPQSGSWSFDGLQHASGGGPSLIWPEPRYQRRIVPDWMARIAGHQDRTTPDIAADADGESGLAVGDIYPNRSGRLGPYTPAIGNGTSQATPLVAGIVADAQQGQRTPYGFINPLLYTLRPSAFNQTLPVNALTPPDERASYDLDFPGTPPELELLDFQQPDETSQVTARGYDTMTGLGSPNGSAFIDALRAR